MPATYFIIDFAYNPTAKQPLAIFEFGDAFQSDYPEKVLSRDGCTPYSTLLRDVARLYPDAMLVSLGNGLSIIDFAKKAALRVFDNAAPFVMNDRELAPHNIELVNFIKLIIDNAAQRAASARTLLLNLAHPAYFAEFGLETNDSQSIKFLNGASVSLLAAFYSKAILARAASKNPIFPVTLIVPGFEDDLPLTDPLVSDEAIEAFLRQANAEYFIIKPSTGTHSEHVHLLKRERVKQIIQRKFGADTFLSPAARAAYRRYGCLLQVCHLSPALAYKDARYHAKARAIIRADFAPQDETVQATLITAYWQLANQPVNSDLTDSNVIANIQANPAGVLEIDPHHYKNIRQLFAAHLPEILLNLWRPDLKMKRYVNSFHPKRARMFDKNSQVAHLQNVLTNFITTHYIMPQISPSQDKLYYYVNRYFDNNNHKRVAKSFLVDALGFKRDTNRQLRDSGAPLTQFAALCANAFFAADNTLVDTPATHAYRAQHELKYFMLYFMLSYTVLSVIAHEKDSRAFLAFTSAMGAIINRVCYHSFNCANARLFKPRAPTLVIALNASPTKAPALRG